MFCSKCGKEVRAGDAFCDGCGAKVSVSTSSYGMGTVTKNEEKGECNKLILFFEKASLMLSALIMFLSTFLIKLWYGSMQKTGSYIAVEKEYHSVYPTYESARRIEVWDNAQSVADTLDVFLLIGAILFVLGVVLCVLEYMGKIHKSKVFNICCFFIPIAVAVIVAIYAYPAIDEYERLFSF